ncbi:unnamed protein product [Euphydryas editha]|uniref:PiggyBac transposable element-derived protein domain-containing protein n=1 Tax=Euphydryas editha TaxID=104508 RepID=A0AAU9VFR0_EUPED|nr:unnamed protein product [Euphydryas editha]
MKGHVTNSTKDVVVIKWMDNKGVVLASNFVGIGNQDEVRRWNEVSKKYVTIPRPELVRLYNNGMVGVDKTDHLVSLYRIFIRSKKWTLRMIFHALNLALVSTNSWLEYQEDCKICNIPSTDVLDLLHFRQRVAEALIKMGQPISSKKRGRPASGGSSPVNLPITPKQHRFRNEIRPASEIQ